MRSVSESCAFCALCVLVAAFAVTCAPGKVARAEPSVDPSYGRIEGDVTLVVGAGAVAASNGARLEGELRARYLETAGVFAAYEDGPAIGSGVQPRRTVAGGIELRPLFLYRWLDGHETHRAPLDLTLDSLGVELGFAFAQGPGGFGARPGLQVGLGVEFPLFLEATGPWIGVHGGLRWSDATLAAGTRDNSLDREAFVAVTVAWHEVVSTHAIDANDRAPR